MPYFNLDNMGKIEDVTIVLCRRDKSVIGTLYPVKDYKTTDSLADASTVSFSYYRSTDGGTNEMYDKLTDLQLIYIPEKSEYYEISVTEDENEEGLFKTVSGTDLCSCELGQIILRNLEFNTESDIERDDYKPCHIYDNTDSSTIADSLIPRILKDKAPHYRIKHIDKSLGRLQRTFSINGTSIIDFLRGSLSEEIDCLVVTDSMDRSISLYDTLCSCNDCNYRGDDFDGSCPKCGSINYTSGYGSNTNIVVSVENLARDISVSTDKDSIKNCFYITGGDDIMTNMIAACNPNGTNYIYKFSKEQLADMPCELSDKINSYNVLYSRLQPQYKNININIFNLLDEISNIKYGKSDKEMQSDTDCGKELNKILQSDISSISISSLSNITNTGINNSIIAYLKIFLSSGYSVKILDDYSCSYNSDNNTYTWCGGIRVYKTSNDEIYCDSEKISIIIDENYTNFIEQKMSKTLAKYNLENSSTEPDWSKYPLSLLSSFESAYQSCLDVLIEQGCGHEGSLCHNIYQKYYNRHKNIENQIKISECSIEVLNTELNEYYAQRTALQHELDFHKYLGDELWNIFSAYRREDEYSNSNYISDGLGNEEVLEQAEELLNKANVELNKACETAYTISSTINNFLMMKEFEGIREQCRLGNWIYVQTSYDDLYKLRIVEIGIDYNDISNISVTFSNAFKLTSGSNIINNTIKQSQNMATSYDSVKYQAGSGKEASDNMNIWMQEGLDASLYAIKNSSAEEVTFNNSGLTCKSYDDVTDDYSPEQFKATHKVIAFTKDNWKTVSTALGKMPYHYYDIESDSLKDTEDYGLTAQFVMAGYITGSQMISGDIYSPNFSKANKTGTHIDLENAEFEFYGNGSGSQLKLIHENNTAMLQMLNGRIIAGQIYSTDFTTIPKDDNGKPMTDPKTKIDLDEGTFSFASGALKYDNDSYMVFTKGGFRVTGGNDNTYTCGIFDSRGIDLCGGTNNHIGNFYIGDQGLTLDLGYDFDERTSTETSDYNIMQILGSSDTADGNASLRFRTPIKYLTSFSDDRTQTEIYYNGLTIQKVTWDDGYKIIGDGEESVRLDIDGLYVNNHTFIDSEGFRTVKKISVTSTLETLLDVATANGTSLFKITQSSVYINNGKLRCANDIEVNGINIADAIRTLQNQVSNIQSPSPTAQ